MKETGEVGWMAETSQARRTSRGQGSFHRGSKRVKGLQAAGGEGQVGKGSRNSSCSGFEGE